MSFITPQAAFVIHMSYIYSISVIVANLSIPPFGLTSSLIEETRPPGGFLFYRTALFASWVMASEATLVAKTLKKRCNARKKRAVRCIDTGLVYASSADASDILSEKGLIVNSRTILYNCSGRGKSAGGLRWEYADI